MRSIRATPRDIQLHLDRAEPGDEIVLQAGRYGSRLRMFGRLGTAAEPIVVRAERGAVLDGGMRAEDYRVTANRLALEVHEEQRGYPGLWPWMRDGQLSIRNCRYVNLIDLKVRNSWPTLIALENVRDIKIAGARLRDGAFAIGALGRETSGISVDGCQWVQDPVPNRMWKEIAWARIHGDPNDDEPVDVEKDWRLFDGDFFRGDGIRGGVQIRHCRIKAAFNAIHLFNDGDDSDLARDIEVAYCTFREIRDNVFEAETCAHNWRFHHNEIVNAHKPFSLEQKRSGHFYIFANRLWFDSVPGPPEDTHSGGGVIKAGKSFNPSFGHHYFFNNSISTRSSYIAKGLLIRFLHQNNAVRYARADDPVHDADVQLFGELNAPPNDLADRFTTEWQQLGIAMSGDLMLHESWPEALQRAGYMIENGIGADPGFRNPFKGDLRLTRDSPCRRRAQALRVGLPDGTEWSHPGGGHIGAWQGKTLLDGPGFVSTATLVA